ncbi:DUF6083 domain-containing protein [Streptomyces sp. NPDC018321]|uniref:DUF6083 domain-containing protein n=1 Tax=unclassified Streptomyces TaxID=2593676 RepID=UPI00379E9661
MAGRRRVGPGSRSVIGAARRGWTDFYQRPTALPPPELAAALVPVSCRWHLSCGIVHPHGDGSAWCRIPHAVLCPARIPTLRLTSHAEEMRRRLGVRSRRLIDSGDFAPAAPPPHEPDASSARPAVPSCICCWAAVSPPADGGPPVCGPDPAPPPLSAARTGSRRPKGVFKLLPAGPQRGQLALPTGTMAVCDLSRLP